MSTIHVKQIDAFTRIPFGGNPAGLVSDAAGLSDDLKLKIAREVNASETAFISPSTVADFKFQYFTPGTEVDMCGHATVGAFFALADEGKLDPAKERYSIETRAGVLAVERAQVAGDEIFRLTLPVPQFVDLEISRKEIAALLGLEENDILDTPPMKVYTGIWWMAFGVRELNKLMTIKPDLPAIESISRQWDACGITPFCLQTLDSKMSYHMRAIAPAVGVAEDPVCGTGNGVVSSYLVHNGLAGSEPQVDLIGEQGMEVNRPGCVYVRVTRQNDAINMLQIGGTAVTVLEGNILY